MIGGDSRQGMCSVQYPVLVSTESINVRYHSGVPPAMLYQRAYQEV